jgi:hypothetical protein
MMPLNEVVVKEREIILKETKVWASRREQKMRWPDGRHGQGYLKRDRV